MTMHNARSFPDLLHDIGGHIEEIIRSEFLLAKTELKEQGAKAIEPVIMLGTGAVFGVWCVGFLLLTIMFGIGIVLASWLSALIVCVFAAIVSFSLIKIGVDGLKKIRAPEKTIRTVKEDVQWAQERMR